MRVLHVNPARGWRGGERQVWLLARELARRGWDSPVAGAPGGALLRRLRAEGLPGVGLALHADLDPLGVGKLGILLRRLRPQLLHAHTGRAHAAAGLAARLAGYRPVLVTRRLELPVRGVLGRWKYVHLADHYVAISESVERSLRAAGVPPERIDRIPSGVELPVRTPRRLAEGKTWTVGTLAAFTPQKDPTAWLATVRRVCARDPNVRFLWAGEGELLGRTRVAVQRAGLAGRVALPGFLEDPEPFWRDLDVFFLPSAFEALGSVLLDALARGIPVVATSVGGIPEVVRPGREGLLARAGDAEGLSAALLRLRRDPALAERLSRGGIQRAETFEIGRVVDRIVEVYEKLTGAPGAEGVRP